MAILITIEAPKGERVVVTHSVEILNVQAKPDNHADYKVKVYPTDLRECMKFPKPTLQATVENFDRGLGIMALVQQSFKALDLT